MCNILLENSLPPHQHCYEDSLHFHSYIVVSLFTEQILCICSVLANAKHSPSEELFPLRTSDGALQALAVFIHYQTRLIGR